jgi:hypothetical protein
MRTKVFYEQLFALKRLGFLLECTFSRMKNIEIANCVVSNLVKLENLNLINTAYEKVIQISESKDLSFFGVILFDNWACKHA